MRTRSFALLLPLCCAVLLAACYPPATPVPIGSPVLQPDADQGLPLVGTNWSLDKLNGEPLLTQTYISALFDEEGAVSGTSGCNSYSGSYQVDGSSLTVGMTVTTMMACAEPVMEQEAAYLAAAVHQRHQHPRDYARLSRRRRGDTGDQGGRMNVEP